MSLPRYVVLHKQIGETPLEAAHAWKAAHPEYATVPVTYAGRLDPMASGKLLVLLGDECKRQVAYRGLDKEYEIEVVLDFATDTGDALGIPVYRTIHSDPTRAAIHTVLRSLRGTHIVPYPAFSSKTVEGKPLFEYALEGTMAEINVPTHEETIYSIHVLEHTSISLSELSRRIESTLATVPTSTEPSKKRGAEFRQHEIRAAWKQLFETVPERNVTVVKLRVRSKSGAYMRTLAQRIGEALATSAFALSITRTRIGTYLPLSPFFGWWLRDLT